jgi:YggT family protein
MPNLLVLRLLSFINWLLGMYVVVLFAAVIMSWLVSFDVVNRRNPTVAMVGDLLYQLTEPALRPIRRRLPHLGPFDLSPFVLFLIIVFIQWVIIPTLADLFK